MNHAQKRTAGGAAALVLHKQAASKPQGQCIKPELAAVVEARPGYTAAEIAHTLGVQPDQVRRAIYRAHLGQRLQAGPMRRCVKTGRRANTWYLQEGTQ
ncbi:MULTISPECIES: hypothetical protein [unclassified Thioalkalivibrio]|uniref:hypothetical protein n=1 Tax=unclassified Thioalkalivibrio TaxID=2621013 RepID=UPI000374B353|nr:MULTISPECIES: hypothetical protein [unclassified Thioalkalivibrio]